MLRARELPVDDARWVWLADAAGQRLYYPPDVSGWDDERWLDTSRTRARWLLITYVVEDSWVDPWSDDVSYDPTEEPEPAFEQALAAWDYPPLRADDHAELLRFARDAWSGVTAGWQQSPVRAMRQNALRQLIATSPDYQVC
jgi:hypothetical protein